MSNDAGDPDPFADLTAKELRVVELVAEGYINTEIAAKLRRTESFVQRCMLNIYDKIGVSTRIELVMVVLGRRGRGD
jgi:DNA-binding NarL/FixJ family response regulator